MIESPETTLKVFLQIEIETHTQNLNLHIMADNQRRTPKISTVKVCTDSGATADIIKEDLVNILGCKMKMNTLHNELKTTEESPTK